jgi:LysR family transcriptional regulator, glycine cleavage system transcriptional activator
MGSNLFGLAIQAATQGLGIAFIPRLFLDSVLATGSLIQIPGSTPIRTGSYHWLNPRGKLSRIADGFINWLADANDPGTLWSG